MNVGQSAGTMKKEFLPLAQAVARVLADAGEGVLDAPKRFFGCLLDLADPECVEMRVLAGCCGPDLLAHVKEAAGGG